MLNPEYKDIEAAVEFVIDTTCFISDDGWEVEPEYTDGDVWYGDDDYTVAAYDTDYTANDYISCGGFTCLVHGNV